MRRRGWRRLSGFIFTTYTEVFAGLTACNSLNVRVRDL
jgi:hypothetical protein